MKKKNKSKRIGIGGYKLEELKVKLRKDSVQQPFFISNLF